MKAAQEIFQQFRDKARTVLYGNLGDGHWAQNEAELLHGTTGLERALVSLKEQTLEAVAGTVLMTPVAVVLSPSVLLGINSLSAEAGHFDNTQEWNSQSSIEARLEPVSMTYLPPINHESSLNLYINSPIAKEQTYFVVDGDEVADPSSIEPSLVLPEYGLHDIDQIRLNQYGVQPIGSDPNSTEYPHNLLMEVVAGRLTQEGTTIVPLSMIDLQFNDISYRPVDSYKVGRRGGMQPGIVDSTHVIVGVTEAGQAIAVFASDELGNMTGINTGNEGLGIMQLKWGPHSSSEWANVLGVYLENGFNPILSVDGDLVYYPTDIDPEPGAVKNASLVPAFVSEYQAPEFKIQRESLDEMSNGRYQIEDNGGVWDSNTKTLIPGITLDKNGSIWITVNGVEIDLGTTAINTNKDGQLFAGGYELMNGVWVEATTIGDSQNENKPVIVFPVCSDFTKFKEYPVDFNQLQEQGRFVQSTLTSEMIDPTKINLVEAYSLLGNKFLIPDVEQAPHYTEPGSAPFLKNIMCGTTQIDGHTFLTIQVPYYIEGVDPSDWPVITGLKLLPEGFEGAWVSGAVFFQNEMNLVPWDVTEFSYAKRAINPRTGNNFTQAELKQIVAEMKQGNFANTNGLVLSFDVGDSKKGWYK